MKNSPKFDSGRASRAGGGAEAASAALRRAELIEDTINVAAIVLIALVVANLLRWEMSVH